MRSNFCGGDWLAMGVKRSPCKSLTWSVRWWFSMFLAASFKAWGQMSVAIILAVGALVAIAVGMQAEPVHRSQIRWGGWRVFRKSRAASTRSSVSGRGISAAGLVSIWRE